MESSRDAICRHGFLLGNGKVTNALYRARYSRRLPTSSLLENVYSRFCLTVHDLPPLLTLLSLDTGLEIDCVKALEVDCLSEHSGRTQKTQAVACVSMWCNRVLVNGSTTDLEQ